MFRKIIPLLFCLLILNCKPAVRKEQTSDPQLAVVVRTFKQLLDSGSYKAARSFVEEHIDNTRFLREMLGKYIPDSEPHKISDFFRSYTHSAKGVALTEEINQLAGKIAIADVEGFERYFLQIKDRVQQVKELYVKRNALVINAPTSNGDLHYKLLVEARNDFDKWRRNVDKLLRKNVLKHEKTQKLGFSERIRKQLLEISVELKRLHSSIGMRPEHIP